MFTLRKIFKDGIQSNTYLGSSYNYIGKEESPTEFERAINTLLDTPNDGEREGIYAFVTPEDGSTLYALFKSGSNYIMNEKGKTFANVSFR